MGRLLSLPVRSAAGEAALLRRELIASLRDRRAPVVEEMVDAVQRAGLVPALQVGGVPAGRRLDPAVQIMLAAWEHNRPLHPVELDALRDLGREVAAAGMPLWRLLSAVQVAAQAGWQCAVQHAVPVMDSARRPGMAGQLVGDLSVELLDVVGRMQAQIAAGYGEVRTAARHLPVIPAGG
jgi:hypothetical protein